ncbi:lipase family protein [Nocardia nova]
MTSSPPESAAASTARAASIRRWLRLVAGVLLVLLGAFLTVAPFSSLAVLWCVAIAGLVGSAVSGLLRARRWRDVRRWVESSVYLAAALLALWWPGITTEVLAVVVGVALIVAGLTGLPLVWRERGATRFDGIVGGATSVVFGMLALAWPDVTVLVVAVLFGAALMVIGVRQVIAAIGGDHRPLGATAPQRTPRGGRWRVAGTVMGATVALVLALVSVALHRDSPAPDEFYTPQASVPDRAGQLLRTERYDNPEVPTGALAWRILYTTTRDHGQPAVASGLVIAPGSATTTPSPVIAWAHGTTGVAVGCAPSILPNGLSAGAMMVQDKVIHQGWTIVATDYIGLGTAGTHPYLIGEGEARSVLDAVRAALQLPDIRLTDHAVVWGHSQGGHAALWTGIRAPRYAPELVIDGVAALAPASNLPALVDSLGSVTAGEVFASYVITAYAGTYPDTRFDDYVRPGARIITREMAQRCLAEKSVLVSVLTSLFLDKPIWRGDPDRGPLLDNLRRNVPSAVIPAPVFIGQGTADTLVVPSAQDGYVAQRCRAGYAVDYRTYPNLGHLQVVEPESPAIADLIAWTADRFARRPAANTC